MADHNKKLLVKLRCGSACKTTVIVLQLLSLAAVIAAGWYWQEQRWHAYRQPGVLPHYAELLTAKHRLNSTSSLVFGGDVMLARNVQVLQAKAGSYDRAWEYIAAEFAAGDVAAVNLESPFTDQGEYPTAGFIFQARPENITGLQLAGIDAVHLGNNHFGNAGRYGMLYTISLLNDNGIAYVGAGTDQNDAYRGRILTVGDMNIGFVGQGYDVPEYRVGTDAPGVAVFDETRLVDEIAALRSDGADMVVAFFHGGIEYTRKPNAEQRAFAHAAIDAGADIVIGHHPHWIQDTEYYRQGYIFYSLGNLIFDQNWSQETREGLVVKVLVKEKKIVGFELLPVIIDLNYRPRFATPAEATAILSQIDIPFGDMVLDSSSSAVYTSENIHSHQPEEGT